MIQHALVTRAHNPRRSGRPVFAGPLFALLGAVILTGCYDQLIAPGVESDGRITVTNDDAILDQRMVYMDESIAIDAPAPGAFTGAMAEGPFLAPSAVDLRLIAEVRPPTVDGEVVQATSVSRRTANSFVVSYNMRGAQSLGSVDYIVNLFGRFPRLFSSATFNDSDVSAVALDGSAIYAAQQTTAPGFASPAAIERLRFSWFGIRFEQNARFDLTSFAATSVLALPDHLYVTTGSSSGDVYALDKSDLSVVAQHGLEDARWVEHDPDNNRIVVAQGTPGRISVFEEGAFSGGSMNLLGTYTFPGADVIDSKSTVEIVGGKAFIAAGPEGVQVMCLDNGQIVGNVPRPDPAALGLDPSVVVTNAVTVDGDLMFISNGEAGVYVAAGATDFDSTPCTQPLSISVMGQVRFANLQSANHVDYRNGYLVVAAGLGGLKIVDVDITP